MSKNSEKNTVNTNIVLDINKYIKQLSKMQVDLFKTGISSDEYNEISEMITNLKEYMINCHSYNGN